MAGFAVIMIATDSVVLNAIHRRRSACSEFGCSMKMLSADLAARACSSIHSKFEFNENEEVGQC